MTLTKNILFAWLSALVLLTSCSLTRSGGNNLRIEVSDTQGRPLRGAISARSAADLFDNAGHARASITITSAPDAACVFVGVNGGLVKPSHSAKNISGLFESCSAIEELGHTSGLSTFESLQKEGVSLSLTTGKRTFMLYAVNISGHDAAAGCPVTTLEEAFALDPLLTLFAFAKSDEILVDAQTTSVSLSMVKESPLESILSTECYDAKITPPSNLQASALSPTSIRLSWTDNSDKETGYQIERSADGANWTLIDTMAAGKTTWTNTGLSSNTKYYYRLTAFNLAGSATALQTDATTSANPPLAPTGVTATSVSTTEVRLDWTDGGGGTVTSYEIFRAPTAGGFGANPTATVAAGTLTYTFTGLNPDTRSYFKIRAVGPDGSSSFSTVVDQRTRPSTPTLDSATANSPTQVTVTWSPHSAGQTVWNIEYSSDGGNTWTKVTEAPTATARAVTGLTPATTYTFRVQAEHSGGTSGYSGQLTARTYLVAPSALAVTAISETAITVSFEDNSENETGFKIESSTDGTNYTDRTTLSQNPGTGAVTWNDTNNTAGQIRYYKVYAFDASGPSLTVGPVSATPALAAPTNVVLTAPTSTSIHVVWTDNSAVEDGYKIELSSDGGVTYTTKATATVGTSYDITTGVTVNVEHHVRVSTVKGATLAAATPQLITPTNGLDPPMPNSVQIDSHRAATISWASVVGAQSYKVQVRRTDSPGAWITAVDDLTLLSYAVTSLSPDTDYTFRVYAKDTGGALSAPSSEVSGLTQVSPVDISSVTALSATTARVTWTASAEATSYRVERRRADALGTVALNWTAATTTSLNEVMGGLTPNVEYSFRVYAVHGANESAASTESTATTWLGTPTALTATQHPTSEAAINLQWTRGTAAETEVQIWRGEDGGMPQRIDTVATTETYVDSDPSLEFGKAYVYQVRSKTATNTSDFSEPSPPLTFHLNAPTALVADATTYTDRVGLTWQDNSSNESQYVIYRETNGSGNFVLMGTRTALPRTLYEDSTVSAGNNYVYKVCAANAANESCTLTGSVTFAVLGSFHVDNALTKPDKITLAWTDLPTEIGYELQWNPTSATLSDGSWSSQVLAAESVSKEITSLVPDKTYYFRLRARYAAAPVDGEWSPVVSALTASGVPDTFTATSSSAVSTTLTWEDVSNEDHYDIQWNEVSATAADEDWRTDIPSPATGVTSTVHSGLHPARTYYYRVRAAFGSGATFVYSAWKGASVATAAGIPASFTSSPADSTSMSLTWSSTPDAIAYDVQFNTSSATAANEAWNTSIPQQVSTAFVHTGLTSSTIYYYRVRAVYPGTGNVSDWKATSATTGSNKPQNLAATATVDTMELTWDAFAGAVDYDVRITIASDEPVGDRPVMASTGRVANASGLTPARPYYLAVRAILSGPTYSDWAYLTKSTTGGWDVLGQAGTLRPGPTTGHTAIWTGATGNPATANRMIVWGGTDGTTPRKTGYIFNPADDTWTEMPTPPNDLAERSYHTAIWTGATGNPATANRMIVWGGIGAGSLIFNDGAVFDPAGAAGSEWTYLAANPIQPRFRHSAVWTGEHMIIFGGRTNGDPATVFDDGAHYDLAANSWTTIAPSAQIFPRFAHTAVWAEERNEMIVFGGMSPEDTSVALAGGGTLVFMTDHYSWLSPTDPTLQPLNRGYHSAVWTGSKMVTFGGRDGSIGFMSGGLFDPSQPAGSTWTTMNEPSLVGRSEGSTVWAADIGKVITWGGVSELSLVDTGGVFDPEDNSWDTLPASTGVLTERKEATVVWTGTELLIFGGLDGAGASATGARHVLSTAQREPFGSRH